MRPTVAVMASLMATALALAAEITGASAPQWRPCTGWVTKAPAEYGVADGSGALVFTARGAGTEMPWIINVERVGVSGDERYVLVKYRARGLAAGPAIYFLHGEEGSYGGRAYAMADELKPDDQWHVLAVDLAAINPLEATHNLALKVFVDDSGSARLEVQRLWFDNALPPEAQLARVPGQRPEEVVPVPAQADRFLPRTGWTTAPASDFAAEQAGEAVAFRAGGQGRGMRWLLALPKTVELSRTPYLSLRYRAAGSLGHTTYAVWLGDQESGSGGHSLLALAASDLKTDGAWHNVSVKLTQTFPVTHLAVGLDCEGQEARLSLEGVQFSSRPHRWPVAQMLPYETRAGAWPQGQGGFTTDPAGATGGAPSAFLQQRLGASDWFAAREITVGGVPFAVPGEPTAVRQTATTDLGTLSLKLPPGVREVYLLTAAMAPATELFGIDWQHPRPVELLDVPEKTYFEVRYAAGPPDQVLPLDAETGRWGMRRGLGVCVVHPDPKRQATELVLHDGMQTAAFAIVGTTMLVAAPRVSEPTWKGLAYATPPGKVLPPFRGAASDVNTVYANVLRASFGTDHGLTLSSLSVEGLEGALQCQAGPIFEVSIGGKVLPAEDWVADKEPMGGPPPETGWPRFVLHNRAAGLAAVVECLPATEEGAAPRGGPAALRRDPRELLLRMRLTNEGNAPVTATLKFPVVRGLRLGTAADTWYLSGKRGGIINEADFTTRDPLGERHPLQVDGFFGRGLALACLTHDTEAMHHFISLSKSAEGGAWAAEYVERDLPPGASFDTTEAALVLREGDWRAIFAAYTDWLKTWFQPAAPRKPWFERVFALISGNGHYGASPDPKVRGNVQRLVDTMMKHVGVCDYAHVFGWGASKQYGDWGDYSHYEEVGGRETFHDNIAALQQQGIAVSLYLDGYLSSEKGQIVGAHAQEWAMKRADGSPQYVKEYDSYNECPYMAGWRQHLADTYARVQRDVRPKIMYIDEIGATDGRWLCRAKDHGHNGYEIPYAGEVELLKAIRGAVGPDVALYTEYAPAEVSRRYLDGSISYQALWSADQEALAPHFIDLPRFAFPDFKQFHIIYYVTTRAGNWWLLKYPFFNGEVYRIGEPNLPNMDAPSQAFQKRAVLVQCAHREAFASHNVRPLVPTEVSGVFANLFMGPRENVWTLYNANGRSVRQPVLRVKHAAGATYEDAWNGTKLAPQVKDGVAAVAVELGPKAVGCVVQKLR
ncbi:DUF6259 domain-containing protein [bacterium]|nr:DUF6259 domain-containing protein [bacterium]